MSRVVYIATFTISLLTTILVLTLYHESKNKLNYAEVSTLNETISNKMVQNTSTGMEKVIVEVYYESLCPSSIHFFVDELEPEIPAMHQFLDIRLYPYGNAYTKEHDGHYVFECQHGEYECYGNKLHACAIDILKNVTKSTLFICCLSDWRSNDKAVDECAKWLKFDGNPVKECAKSDKGNQLLKYYGDESGKVDYYSGVPHVRINGEHVSWGDFKENACMAFKQPPPPCSNVTMSTNEDESDE